MKTKPVSVAPQYRPEFLVDLLVLPQTSTTTLPIDPRNFGTESFSDGANPVSGELKEIPEPRGHPFGGIND